MSVIKKTIIIFLIFFVCHKYSFSQQLYVHRFGEKGPPQDIQRIVDRGRLIISMHRRNYAPFFTDENKELRGFDVDLAKDIAEKLGIKEVEFLRDNDSFDEIVEKIANQKADIAISYVSKTLSRQKKVLYSKPYITLRTGILISRKFAAEKNLSEKNLFQELDRKDAIFAAEKGGAFNEFTQIRFPNATLLSLPSRDDLYKALIENKINAVYNEEYLIKVFFKKNPGQAIYYKPIYIENSEDYISIVMPGDAYNLKEWIDLYLDFRREKLNFDDLYNRYVEVKKENGS